MQAAIGQPGGGGGALFLRTFSAMRGLGSGYRKDSGFCGLREYTYYTKVTLAASIG